MTDGIVVTATATGARFGIRVIPRASKTVVGGERDGRLVVRVTAPPVDRAANEAAVAALAVALDVPAARVRIAAGATSRNKTVDVSGVGAAEMQKKLASL